MPTKPQTYRPRCGRTRQQSNREYDARRGSARSRGYSSRWDKAARSFKRKHPLCLGCEAVGRLVASEIVDHVVPHKGDWDRFWDPENWQPSCSWHHDKVKQRLEAQYAAGQINENALRLDSDAAKVLTRLLQG